MSNEKVFQMKLQKVYPLLVAKAEKKGRSRGEVDAAACWLTGYSQEQLAALLESDIAYWDFFRQAPAPHPNRGLITGSVCGVKVEAIQDPLLREIRYLDKLVDELAKGKPLEKVLRQGGASKARRANTERNTPTCFGWELFCQKEREPLPKAAALFGGTRKY